jgi:hypothetical protein
MNGITMVSPPLRPLPSTRRFLRKEIPNHQLATPLMNHNDESPLTKFTFQAKIDVNRNRSNKQPFRIKALLIEILLQHQRVDPTFHVLPTEEGSSTAGVITTASDVPNNEEAQLMKYVKKMHDVDNRNNSKSYTVVFYVKIASAMTLSMVMKNDNALFKWLTTNKSGFVHSPSPQPTISSTPASSVT